jgi:hypothetical protein
MHTTSARLATTALVIWLFATPARGQQSEPATEFQSAIPGWSFTPTVGTGVLHDTNVALSGGRGASGETEGDSGFTVVPSGQLRYLGRRTDFSANYRGFLRRYAHLDGLDEYSSRASVNFSRALTKRLFVFALDSFATSPTTDMVELNGIPFARTGSRGNTFSAGANVTLSKLMRFSTRLDSTWLNFDHPEDTPFLSGGWIHGLQNELSRQISSRVSAGAEYSFRTSTVDKGDRNFSFQDMGGVLRFKLGPHTSASAAGGFGMLHDRTVDVVRTGPYVRLGINHEFEFAIVGAGFQRQNVPSFGFGGASSSQELRADVRTPLMRKRMYVHGSAAWRHILPFEDPGFELDTILLRSTVGYSIARWASLEGVYIFTRQDSFEIDGGEVNRHQAGIQFVVSQPVRIR